MKKDIEFTKVENVFMAIVKEYNKEFQCDDWNAYIINNKEVAIDMVLIVSKGYNEDTLQETAVLRHKIESMPAKSFAKVELMQENLLTLTNFFNVTFFEGNKMLDRRYSFEKGTVKEETLRMIPLLEKRGVLLK
ncbi:MAG: hypothetical protein COB98_08470 [Flavobacteriaceae bacterium]|nr:MAG: hypothetical protein COB98_08470 [Flavobacteriaceae bacterium]